MWSNKDEKKFSFKPHTEIEGEEGGGEVDEEFQKCSRHEEFSLACIYCECKPQD